MAITVSLPLSLVSQSEFMERLAKYNIINIIYISNILYIEL